MHAQITQIKPSATLLTHRRTETSVLTHGYPAINPVENKYTFDTIENIKEPLRISQQYLDIKKIFSDKSEEMFTQS